YYDIISMSYLFLSCTEPNINNQVKMEGFNRVDAAIGYSADPWNVTLAVNNLTNKEYWRSDSMPGTPRNVLLRLNYQF
ncbi:TonB-dependent receptor, partial [Acinetobacter baumannii]